MNGRVQEPAVARMLSPDPFLGNLADPQSLNPYSYARNNPVSYVDPSGFFLGRIGKFFSRAIQGAGHFLRRTVRKYGRQIVAAIAAYYTAGAVSGAIIEGATPAVTAAASDGFVNTAITMAAEAQTTATIAGGVAGGAVGGAISTGSLKGTIQGAVTGGVFGGIDVGFHGQYSAGRVLADASAGGLTTSIQGGEFGKGALLAGIGSGAEYAYREIVEFSTTWAPGGPAQTKTDLQLPKQGPNNIGTAGDVARDAFWKEGGLASRVLNRVPGINAVAGLHDVFQVKLGTGLARDVFNVPGMAVAAPITYSALMRGAPSVLVALDEG